MNGKMENLACGIIAPALILLNCIYNLIIFEVSVPQGRYMPWKVYTDPFNVFKVVFFKAGIASVLILYYYVYGELKIEKSNKIFIALVAPLLLAVFMAAFQLFFL